MNRIKVLCTLAAIVAMASAFTAKKTNTYYARATSSTTFVWVLGTPPTEEDCDYPIAAACSIIMEDEKTPTDNEVPNEEDGLISQQGENVYSPL